MASKEDDTLPLPVLSLEYSIDATADEDFIPTSQPPGNSCSKVTRISGTPPQNQSANASSEEPNASAAPADDTLPREDVIHPKTLDTDKSSDFIPDTDTKTIQTVQALSSEPSCRKNLSVFPDDIASQAQSSPLWETHQFSLLNGSPVEAKPPRLGTPDKSIAEIVVDDSAETVDLEVSPKKVGKSESGLKAVEMLSVESSINSDAGRCEETQVFDNSSVLLLEHPGHLIGNQSEKSIKEPTPSQDLYLANTIENESDLQEHLLVCSYSSPSAAAVAADTTRGFNQDLGNATRSKENAIPKGAPGVTVEDESSVTMRKMDFKLTVTCFVSFNTKTNKVLQKFISKVSEAPKSLPKPPVHWDHLSDCTSDKSKRYSTSSSGSVYSDKHGLPFALPKRVSAVSDQTDSSEEDLAARIMKEKNMALGRTPWSNEYLLPMKLDELVQASIENHLTMDRVLSMREPKRRSSTDISLGKETVKSSSSEAKSVGESAAVAKSPAVAETPSENPNSDSVLPKVVDTTKSDNESDSKEEVSQYEDKRESTEPVVEATETARPEPEPETEPHSAPPKDEEEKKVESPNPDEDASSVVLAAGVRVMARWTDKRYYSGVLGDSTKNDRWEVKFDDGTTKAVREDMIMPMEWLKVGSLVYALVDDNYASGQIVDMQRGKEATFVVELDEEKKTVSVQSSDLCLSDLMAGIVKEKYKPLAGTPRKITDIDFDNVLSGKRRREQRTPMRLSAALQHGSSDQRKTSTSRKKKEDLQTVKETPEQRSTGKRTTGLRSEGGHLVEDKVASADSPSDSEVGGTPLRSSSKDARGRAQPRILSYGHEVARPRRGKLSQWLTEDGIPIPGPSGVKLKKKPRPKEEDSDEPPKKKVEQGRSSPRGVKAKGGSGGRVGDEKGKRRRVDGVAEESVQKKTTKTTTTTRAQKSKSRK